MNRTNKRMLVLATLSVTASVGASVFAGPVTVLSDSFSRSPSGMIVGTPPTRDTTAAAQAAAAANWVSDWGANNNAAGGIITQTYTTYLGNDGAGVPRNFKVDGTNGISGNWLNNGSVAHPLKKTGGTDTITEPIGITGFGWTQVNHNLAANPVITSAERLRISFDIYRSAAGNTSFFIGNSDPTGVVNGNAGSPALIGGNDIGIYFRGIQANTFGLRDNGALPSPVTGIANFDTISYAAGTTLFPQPVPVQIDIVGTGFGSTQSTLELTVGGVLQDLNGTDVAGNGYAFTWDGGSSAYMGFASNNTPVEGTVAAPVYRATGIDNLAVSVVYAPYTWSVDASGNWDDAANWSTNVVPNGSTLTATLGTVITAPRTVTLQTAVALDKLVVNNASAGARYTIDSGGTQKLTVNAIEVNAGRLDLNDSGNADAPVVTGSLMVASGATLNLGTGSLIVNYTGSSPLSGLVADAQAGKITGVGAAVGIVEASAAGITSFRGTTLTGPAVVLIRTLPGDATLDQSVNFDDLLKLAASYNSPGGWHNGDFNYDGTVNFDDLLALAANYNQTLTGSLDGDWALAQTSIPEPAVLSVIGLAVGLSLGRRRR